MNIFCLDEDTKLAALYHVDAHVVKMILEYCQLLCTTHRFFKNNNPVLYRETHVNHPCTVWIRQSKSNYNWLYKLLADVEEQYELRYGREHRSWVLLRDVLKDPPVDLIDIGMTPFAQAMPEKYRGENAIEAYRRYYMGEKRKIAAWTSPATAPPWYICEKIKNDN